MSTALRSVGLLDVVSTTPPGPSVARLVSTPVSTTSLRTLVRYAGQDAIAFFRVKHFSPRYKFYESGSPENDPREAFHPGGNIY
jgi:hypothetical protein